MLNLLLALALAQAPAPAPAQAIEDWRIEGSDGGCVAHAAYRGGTVISVFALPGHEGIGFLLQNRGWTTLEDGAVYPIEVRFGGGGQWRLEATARIEIDHDGPGLFFAVSPGAAEGGRDFMAEFAGARLMHIGHRGARVESLALTGNHEATVALAGCLSRLLGGETWPGADEAAAVRI